MNKASLYATKYATFDASKVRNFANLLGYFKKKVQIAELQQLLEEESQWQMRYAVDPKEKIQRSALLECMITNYCLAINFKYLSHREVNIFLHVEFRNLKELIFSVDSDAGSMTNIQFVQNIDAPNLFRLDISNMEDGGFSLRPLRKSNFPKLQILDLANYLDYFKDFQSLSQAHFPLLRDFRLQKYDEGYPYEDNFWLAKMESPLMCRQLEKQLLIEQQEYTDRPTKIVKQS